jgi:hypothetical protein
LLLTLADLIQRISGLVSPIITLDKPLVDATSHPIVALNIHERAQFRDRQKPTYFVHREANRSAWLDLFRELIRDGIVRDTPVERITDVIAALLYGTMFTNYFAGRRKSLASQCDDILDIVFHGLLVSP